MAWLLERMSIYFTPLISPIFLKTVLLSLFQGFTFTNVVLQLAYYMGFRKDVLVGSDNNFYPGETPKT